MACNELLWSIGMLTKKSRALYFHGQTEAMREHAAKALAAIEDANQAAKSGACGRAKWQIDNARGHLNRARKAKR